MPEGRDFEFEYPSGREVDNQEPPYKPGLSHWCTQEYLDSGNWPDFCPYVFEGPDAGKYYHPHITYVALEVYLANLATPELCGVTWQQILLSPKWMQMKEKIRDILLIGWVSLPSPTNTLVVMIETLC
eukprot:14629924-Ditylum_brightwellii.AAC.1